MTSVQPLAATTRVLLPYRHLQWRSTVIGNVAIVAPGTIVALAVALLAGGRPAPAIVLAALVLVGGVLGSIIPMRARTEVTPNGLVTHWTQGRRRVEVRGEDVKQALVRVVLNVDGVTANRQLFLLDADGRSLFRMCDRWWRETDLATVAHHFEVPIIAEKEPVQLAELRRSVPQQLLWTERHRLVLTGLKVAAGFAACLVVAWLCVSAL